MKTGFISDLHIDINEAYPVMDAVLECAAENKLELLIVAGDICETPDLVRKEMKDLSDKLLDTCGCRLFYVPGNHDMWNKHCPEKNADQIYEMYRKDPLCLSGSPALVSCEKDSSTNQSPSGCEKDNNTNQSLPSCEKDRSANQSLVSNGTDSGTFSKESRERYIGVAGDIGWYDYSFASDRYSTDELNGMSMAGRTWQDKLFNCWTDDNPGKEKFFEEEMRKAIAWCRLKNSSGPEEGCSVNPSVKIIAVNHMLPIKEFCVQEDQANWSFFNAFLGSSALGQLYKELKIDISVCGHVHFRSVIEKDGIRWICPCLGYFSEWPLYKLKDNEVKTHVWDAMQVMDI